MIAIWPALLMAILVLGGLAAVVWGIVYAIANKRPGVAVASLLVPIAVMLGGGLLVTLLARSDAFVQSDSPVHVNWTGGLSVPRIPPIPPMPAMSAAPQTNMDHMSVDPDIAIWIKLAIVLVAVFGIVKYFCKRTSCNGERRGGWAKAFVVLAIVGALLAWRMSQEKVHSVAHGRAEAAQELAEQMRLDTERVNLQAFEAQRKAEEAQAQAAAQVIESSSMMQLFEQLNRPRINLEADGKVASMSIGDGANRVEMRADNGDGAKLVVPISDKTPESIARSLARLERMVEQVSAVADQLSDAGTLIGKGMIALKDTMDSRHQSTSSTVIGSAPLSPPASMVPTIAAAEMKQPVEKQLPIQQTIQISLDQDKLNRFGLSFDKIRATLGREGFWRGRTVRFDASGHHIEVIGELNADYQSRLMGTMVGTVGRSRPPIHMSDVATIDGAPDALQHVATNPNAANSSRPAWVDEMPKKVGNTQRSVIVAGEFATVEECYEQADELLKLATVQYINQFVGGQAAIDEPRLGAFDTISMKKPSMLDRMGIGLDFIRREIAKDEYVETVERSFGPMKKLYTLVEFSPSVEVELQQRWEELRRQDRFATVGLGAGSVLGLMGLVFGLLKVDTWTKGYYTKRLFLGVPAAIIGILGLLSLTAGK